jgi:hypothetical protein
MKGAKRPAQQDAVEGFAEAVDGVTCTRIEQGSCRPVRGICESSIQSRRPRPTDHTPYVESIGQLDGNRLVCRLVAPNGDKL